MREHDERKQGRLRNPSAAHSKGSPPNCPPPSPARHISPCSPAYGPRVEVEETGGAQGTITLELPQTCGRKSGCSSTRAGKAVEG
jgi:hypothetical protein